MSRTILVTGATGKQGGALVKAILAQPDDFIILAATRNPDSASAQRLAQSPLVKLVKGDLDDAPALFQAVKEASPTGNIWGVYSVQTAVFNGPEDPFQNAEYKQGAAVVDEAVKAGVSHFVYSSVDRGGEARSWENPTDIPHFKTKHEVELHLRKSAEGTNMTWTILRPAIFMDNIVPGFMGKVMVTVLRDTMGDKKMPWIYSKDIGAFAAIAFREHAAWNHKAVSLGSEELGFPEINAKFEEIVGYPAPTTFSLIGWAISRGVAEFGRMFDWFAKEGYQVDIEALRKIKPDMTTFDTYLREYSGFVKSA